MKHILTITCSSFTAIIVLFALFSKFDSPFAPEFSNSTVLEFFIMCLSIAIAMLVSKKIEEKFDIPSIFVDAFIRVLICYIIVFFEGCWFEMFSFSWISFLYISPILIPTYIISYALSYFNRVQYANAINYRIQQKK
jgi:hypothetical protein